MAKRVDRFADFLARTAPRNIGPMLNTKMPVSMGPRTIRVTNQLAYWASSRSAPNEFKVPPFTGHSSEEHENAEILLEKFKPRNLPSRIGNIFVAEDPNNVLFGSAFAGRSKIYKVKVDGTVFKANLENYTEVVNNIFKWNGGKLVKMSDYEMEEQAGGWAKEYWRGISSSTPSNLIEWIVNGTVEVIEEI
jgi:hypothetical protein